MYRASVSSVMVVLAACEGSLQIPGQSELRFNAQAQVDDKPIDAGQAAALCALSAGVPSAGPSTWRRVSNTQYEQTVKDLLGFAPDVSALMPDSRFGPFASNTAPVQETTVDGYRIAAEAIAATAAQNVTPLLSGCNTKTTGEDACADRFIDQFGSRLYRHNVTGAEHNALKALYVVGKQESFAQGIAMVIEGALQSPKFLYLVEVGADAGLDDMVKLTSLEVAARLSFLLWNTTPDDALLNAAAQGELDAVDGIRTQAQRLMASPRFADSTAAYFRQLLRVDDLLTDGGVLKDAEDAAALTGALRAALVNELTQFTNGVFKQGGSGTLKEVLTSQVVYPQGPLQAVYGVTPGADGSAKVSDGSRNGILTRAAVMTAVPGAPTRRQAVSRGKLVRSSFFCQSLPPPPGNVDLSLPDNAGMLTEQDLARQHKDNPGCASCHELMDPIGFGFSHMSQMGRFVTTDVTGATVNASGYIIQTDVAGDFSDLAGLMDKLASSRDVRDCTATQMFRFSLGREATAGDACTLAAFVEKLRAGDGDIRAALSDLAVSDTFRYKAKGE